ncbi:hypothetical protein ECE50_009055 [Chitinophaga sp. Mgbs1]|uniref:Lipoprotein n=1 Tax=Chitinophaga solisilvae TaxID=1233460 RepID=A0A9Q5GS64_9BACT|nr:hypothetical protein [Chitinophaga solisilvae]
MCCNISRLLWAACMALLCLVFAACNKEAVISPDEVPDFYSLPQGNQPYDDSIVSFHKKYSSYILYRFTQRDFSYDFRGSISGTAAVANPAYIKSTLEYFRKECMEYYPDEFLIKTMPFKILLCAYIDTIGIDRQTKLPAPPKRAQTGFCATNSMLAIGWADSTLLLQSPAARKRMRGWMHRSYMQQAVASGAMIIPTEFVNLTPLNYEAIKGSEKLYGILEDHYSFEVRENALWDFCSYVCAITSRTKEEMNAAFLNPAYDTRGWARKKYDIVISFFQDKYNVDLQAIGNHP